MSLTCGCVDWDDADWFYEIPEDFATLETKRRKRCCSCRKALDIGSTVLRFDRSRHSLNEIEERICGAQIELAAWYMCEGCGEIYLNLTDVGFCLDISGDMRKDLAEYHSISGFKREAYEH